jgi:hypothetical protein
MVEIRIVDVTDLNAFALVPPCADPGFDHRSCDYWEDADRGSKAARATWLQSDTAKPAADRPALAHNPFAPPASTSTAFNPFLDDPDEPPGSDNPFAPTSRRAMPLRTGVPRKLALLDRGRGVFGSYGRVLLADGEPAAWCQFGPLSAYPRAQRLRDLYPQLPVSPLPAVITCIASTVAGRGEGWATQLAGDVCDELAGRGFAAVEAYPDLTRGPDEASGAHPSFWEHLGFVRAVPDERFPVMRREL